MQLAGSAGGHVLPDHRYGVSANVAHDVAWVFSITELLSIGTVLEVVRGPDWRHGDQDGGFNNSGRVMAVRGNLVLVSWSPLDRVGG
jgi:hypothetical protein